MCKRKLARQHNYHCYIVIVLETTGTRTARRVGRALQRRENDDTVAARGGDECIVEGNRAR